MGVSNELKLHHSYLSITYSYQLGDLNEIICVLSSYYVYNTVLSLEDGTRV